MRDIPGIRARRGRGRPTAVGACAALVLTAGVVTVVRGTDPAAAATVLHDVRAAQVVAAGRAVPARDGMVVPRGASVQTGPAGAARLVTQGRSVYVGAGTSLSVLDGVRERLDRGQLMIDSRRGPRLLVGTDAGDVRTPAGALTRVERAAALRVGVFDGAAEVTPVGRSRAGVRVEVHYQVQVPYGGLPQPTTALALRDDAWEQQLAADLVEADRYLNALGDTLDGSDGAAAHRLAGGVPHRTPTDRSGARRAGARGRPRPDRAAAAPCRSAWQRSAPPGARTGRGVWWPPSWTHRRPVSVRCWTGCAAPPRLRSRLHRTVRRGPPRLSATSWASPAPGLRAPPLRAPRPRPPRPRPPRPCRLAGQPPPRTRARLLARRRPAPGLRPQAVPPGPRPPRAARPTAPLLRAVRHLHRRPASSRPWWTPCSGWSPARWRSPGPRARGQPVSPPRPRLRLRLHRSWSGSRSGTDRSTRRARLPLGRAGVSSRRGRAPPADWPAGRAAR